MGRPFRLRQLRRAFEHILRHRDRIWLTRPGEICAHVEKLPEGRRPGQRRRLRRTQCTLSPEGERAG